MTIHACRYLAARGNTAQMTKPARISITRRAHGYMPGLARRHNGGTQVSGRITR